MGFLCSNLKTFDFILRLLLIPLNIATICVALNTKQNNTDYGKLEFNNFLGLKYMVFTSGVSAGYALFAAVSCYIKWLMNKAWIFFVADQVFAYVMVTSLAAQGEFLYLLYNGDQMVSWSEVCVSYGKFCNTLRIAMGIHVISTSCLLVLSVISAYRVFRRFDPPYIPSKENEREMT